MKRTNRRRRTTKEKIEENEKEKRGGVCTRKGGLRPAPPPLVGGSLLTYLKLRFYSQSILLIPGAQHPPVLLPWSLRYSSSTSTRPAKKNPHTHTH